MLATERTTDALTQLWELHEESERIRRDIEEYIARLGCQHMEARV